MLESTESVSSGSLEPLHARAIVRVIAIVLAVAGGLWALHRLERVALVLIMAGVLSYVIAPLVEIAERPVRFAGRARRLRRGPASAVVYLLLPETVCSTASFLLPRVADQIDDVVARAGAELGGIAGMFLALPAVAIGSVALRHWLDWDEDTAAIAISTLGPPSWR